jgi:hypothetical protein
LAVLNVLAVTSVAHAAVVWTSTFEKGDLSEWTPGTNPTKTLPNGMVRKNVEVLGEQVYTGKYACKITVHPDDLFGPYVQDRVDIQHQSTLTAEGKDTWVSGHYMIPADAGMRNEFAFWESNASFQNVMDFWVEPKTGGGTTINFGVGFLGMTKIWTADFTIGKWHQVALHVHWSTNPQTGSVDIWFDGQQVVTAYKAQTKKDANTLFYQNGLHRRSPPTAAMGNLVDTIYMDDFIEADSFAEAQIGAPITPGADGGRASEAGADGGMSGGASDAATAGSTDAGGAGSGGATSGAGATTGAASTTVSTGASGALGSTGTSAMAGTNGGASGATTGATGTTGAAVGGASGSSAGCHLSGRRAPSAPLASVFALIGIALTRRRRRG